MSENPQIGRFADRVLHAQPIHQGTVAMNPDGRMVNQVPPLHVAAVLHALADFTHNRHMLDVAATSAMARDGDSDWHHGSAVSLGRYFHALGDAIEAHEQFGDELDDGKGA